MRATAPRGPEAGPPLTRFEEADYRVFRIGSFAEGMAAIRAWVTPELTALGERLAPPLRAATADRFFPHVARHARRTVNPPPETWLALGRDPRTYTAYAYLDVVVSRRGVDVRLVLKDEAVDRRAFAGALADERARLAALLAEVPGLAWYLGVPGRRPRGPEAPPVPVGELPEGFRDDLAAALRTRRTAAVELGCGWGKDDRRLAQPAFARLALRALVSLYPLYRLAAAPAR